MSYVPPACDSIIFSSSGIYTPPACDELLFDIGGALPANIISASASVFIESDMAQVAEGFLLLSHNADIPIEGDSHVMEWLAEFNSASADVDIEFPDHSIEILPDIVNSDTVINIESDGAVCRTPEENDLPIGIAPPGEVINWGGFVGISPTKSFPFGQGEDVLQKIRIPYKRQSLPDNTISCSWRSLDWKDGHIGIPANDFALLYDDSTCSSWITLFPFDEHASVAYGNRVFSDDKICTGYKAPEPNDVEKCVGWDESVPYDWHMHIPWGAPAPNDVNKCTTWGPFSYYLLCKGQYWPPKPCYSIPFAFPNKYELTPDVCSGLTFQLNNYDTDTNSRCPWNHWHSGDRDVGSGIIIEVGDDIIFPKPRQVYYMLNQVLVREYITSHPIEVLNVSAVIDRSSWLWQFSVTVASRDCLEWIMPQNGVFKTIIININGYSWHCTVEGWSENRAFGKDAWTITGRSPSMMFGDPIDIKHSGVDISDDAGGQIFDALVTNKTQPSNWPSGLVNWTTDWTTYLGVSSGFDTHSGAHWCIPANTLSYTDQTTIQVMKSLTDSIGAYIQTDPSDNTFHIKPMYKNQPWSWDGTEDDYLGIVEDQCVEISRSYELQPYYNEVIILGESVRANAAGTGAEGDGNSIYTKVWNNDGGVATQAPMVTDNLLTASKASVERGRMILGNTKEWVKHTLRLSTLCPPGVGTGLLLPGQMIAVKERGIPWYGQVTGITVSATTGTGGFTVTQTIAVEEFIKEA